MSTIKCIIDNDDSMEYDVLGFVSEHTFGTSRVLAVVSNKEGYVGVTSVQDIKIIKNS